MFSTVFSILNTRDLVRHFCFLISAGRVLSRFQMEGYGSLDSILVRSTLIPREVH